MFLSHKVARGDVEFGGLRAASTASRSGGVDNKGEFVEPKYCRFSWRHVEMVEIINQEIV